MGNKNEGYLGGILGGASRVASGSAGSLDVTTTNSTTSKSETHTADGTFSTVGDVIIHDGWNQSNGTGGYHPGWGEANEGTLQVVGGNVTVDVEVWGGAGGSGSTIDPGYGGGGEYRKARMVLKPGDYYWMAGGGGSSPGVSIATAGGWGGGGGSGQGTSPGGKGNDGTAFGNGGETIFSVTNGLGAGGGGLSGLFAGSSASQASALIVAAGGGGMGYNGIRGRPGGAESTTLCATSSAGGVGSNSNSGGAGFGGAGYGRGGGGGAGYWGGAGGVDNATQAGGGGGMGFTIASNGHSSIGTVSEVVTEAGSNQNAGGSSSPNFITNLATGVGNSFRSGRGGRIAITIIELSPGSGLKNTGILSLEEAGTQDVGGLTLPQVSWGGITGRSVLTEGSLVNTGIFSLEEIYELTKTN